MRVWRSFEGYLKLDEVFSFNLKLDLVGTHCHIPAVSADHTIIMLGCYKSKLYR